MNTPNNKENTSIHLIENENNSNSNSNTTTPKKRANNDLSKTKANGTKTNAPLNAPCNDAITNARILSPPSVTKPKIRSASKKRKVLKSTEFHKNANANSNAKRSKLCTTKTPKQQSITSFVKQTNKFITIKNKSSPLLTIRNDFIEKIGNKNMLGHIGKHLKNNFATSYTKKRIEGQFESIQVLQMKIVILAPFCQVLIAVLLRIICSYQRAVRLLS